MPLPGFLGQTVRFLRQDLRDHLAEVPPGNRFAMRFRRLSKYLLAAFFHFAGLTGLLLRRSLLSGDACLILGFHGTPDAPPGCFSRGHAISNVRSQLRFLKKHLRPVALDEIALAIARGDSPQAASFAVTFDDGLANNAIHAIPLLQDLEIPATFFVPSAFVGSTRDLWISSLREIVRNWREEAIPPEPGLWPLLPAGGEADLHAAFFRIKQTLKFHEGRRQEILDRLAERAGEHIRPPADDRVVDPDLLRQMVRPGFSVGAHSRNHPVLSSLDPEAAREEIEGSRRDLERLAGSPVLDFSYPNGRFPDFSEVTCRLVAEAGFRCAVTTEPGTVRRGDDRFALRRCLPGNVPAFLASFELLARVWAERHRPGDLAFPLARRVSCLSSQEAGSAA